MSPLPNEFGALTYPEAKELTTKLAWAFGTTFQRPYYGKSNECYILARRVVWSLQQRAGFLESKPASRGSDVEAPE